MTRVCAHLTARTCSEAIDLVFNAAATSAVFATSPIERCFRDVHTLTAHVMLQASNLELAGQVLLGREPVES